MPTSSLASSAGNMVGASEDSSSSNDEELQRFKEAVWDTNVTKEEEDDLRNRLEGDQLASCMGLSVNGPPPGEFLYDQALDGDSDMKHSKRVDGTERARHGAELQVTQGFQTHVAKKLGHFLDSFITEMQPKASSCVTSANDAHDEGFRLFSTSVPGQSAVEPPSPARRRPVPSSSDSDSEMEMRLKEAAVSVSDLFPSAPATEPPALDKREELTEGEDSRVVKKKKERREKKRAGCADHVDVEEEKIKVKRKKKRLPAENPQTMLNQTASPVIRNLPQPMKSRRFRKTAS